MNKKDRDVYLELSRLGNRFIGRDDPIRKEAQRFIKENRNHPLVKGHTIDHRAFGSKEGVVSEDSSLLAVVVNGQISIFR